MEALDLISLDYDKWKSQANQGDTKTKDTVKTEKALQWVCEAYAFQAEKKYEEHKLTYDKANDSLKLELTGKLSWTNIASNLQISCKKELY